MTEPLPLEVLRDGRYAVLRVLGAGSQGDTLEALDKRDGRLVAIKRFQVRGARAWKDVELAEREARVLATLSHPNLPVYVEHFEEAGALYLVMEKIEGETLAALLRQGTRYSSAEVLRFLTDAASALSYLHSRIPPIIHRDIKPGNVIRRKDGSFALVDFGSVRDSLKPEGGSTVVGTFGYMAPEQFQGRALPGSDVFSAAATALAIMTRHEPETLPHRGLAIDVRAALGGTADPRFVRVLEAMLDPNPDTRPSAIAPLLRQHFAQGAVGSTPAGATPQRASAPDTSFNRTDFRQKRRELKAELRSMRRLRRSQRQTAPRDWQRHSALKRALWVTFLLIGLSIARLASSLLFRVFLPALLTLLSVVFGPGLRRAALRCREVGGEVEGALLSATDFVRNNLLVAQASGPRESGPSRPEPEHRVRVAGAPPAPTPVEPGEETAEWQDSEERRRQRS